MNSTELIARTPGLTHRKLDFWCHRGVFGDAKSAGGGSGSRRDFDETEVTIAQVLARLSDSFGGWTGRRGGSVEIYRAVAEQIRDGQETSATVQLGGGTVLIVPLEADLV
jgi:hypothetical protein